MESITQTQDFGKRHGSCDVDQCILIELHQWSCGCSANNISTFTATVELVNHIDSGSLLKLAESEVVTPRTLTTLAENQHVEVRLAVADNPKTPFGTLVHLASDESPDVRYHLAENYDVPEPLLQVLASDDNPFVSQRASHTLERMHAIENAV